MNGARVLVTGSEGLVGAAVIDLLARAGARVRRLDVRASDTQSRGDTRDAATVRDAVEGCDGIIHLAAVSRVVLGERDPSACWDVNVSGTENVVRAALSVRTPPWLLYASSREVYGQADRLPVHEGATLRPLNVYGRSKLAAETLVLDARGAGLRAAVLRLSNVYGSASDHADRVIPAFVRAALANRPLRVDGASCTFDFTHVHDVARALVTAGRLLGSGAALPPLHLVTGTPTSLGQLAATVIRVTGSRSRLEEHAPRAFDVHRFHGDPRRAEEVIGWSARISLASGLEQLIADVGALR